MLVYIYILLLLHNKNTSHSSPPGRSENRFKQRIKPNLLPVSKSHIIPSAKNQIGWAQNNFVVFYRKSNDFFAPANSSFWVNVFYFVCSGRINLIRRFFGLIKCRFLCRIKFYLMRRIIWDLITGSKFGLIRRSTTSTLEIEEYEYYYYIPHS